MVRIGVPNTAAVALPKNATTMWTVATGPCMQLHRDEIPYHGHGNVSKSFLESPLDQLLHFSKQDKATYLYRFSVFVWTHLLPL